jgi:hypothetical protein
MLRHPELENGQSRGLLFAPEKLRENKIGSRAVSNAIKTPAGPSKRYQNAFATTLRAL